MFRAFAAASACMFVLLFSFPAEASADKIEITAGTAALYWDASLTSAQISSADSKFVSEYHGSSSPKFNPDGSVDFSTAIPFTNAGNHPLTQTYRGQMFSGAWISGAMTILARPVVLPPATPEGAMQTFTTSFTMTGAITAYATSARTGPPLFSTDLTGGGTYTTGPYRVINGAWARMNSGADTLRFAQPAETGSLPSPWQSSDVGEVDTVGYAYQGHDGDLYIAGAGSDIWGTADSFHFVYQSMFDGSVSSIAPSGENTHPYAKVGLMIRQSLDPGSPHVILDLKPDGNLEFMTRSAQNGETRFIAGATGPVRSLTLTRKEALVSASICISDGSCRTLGSTLFVSGPALTGAVVTSHNPSILNHGYFPANLPTVTTTPTSLPAAWTSADVGAVGQRGDAFYQRNTFTVDGAGADIWGTADAFHYVYLPMNGEGEIAVAVNSVQNSNFYAKAGVMVRQSLDPGAATVILDVKPDGGIEFMTRYSSGDAMTFIGGGFIVPFPVRLKLTRVVGTVESLFIASVFDSQAGAWRQVGSANIQVTPRALVGLAVTSHDTGTLNRSVFEYPQVVRNLIERGGFEEYTPPALGTPGWISDHPLRKVPAKSETNQPRSGAKNGACWSTTSEDCGMYQEVIAPANGTYVFRVYANADRPGGLVGVNITGVDQGPRDHPRAEVPVRGFHNYGVDPITFGFHAVEGDLIRAWMYSPDVPGYVVIDDATLVQDFGPH